MTNTPPNQPSRRQFVGMVAGVSGLTPMLSNQTLASAQENTPLRLGELDTQEWPTLEGTIVINALGFIGNPNLRYEEDQAEGGALASIGGQITDERAILDLVASGTTAINTTLGYVAGPFDPYEHTIDQIALWNRIISDHPQQLLKVTEAKDILRAHEEGRSGIIFGFQNGEAIEDRVERVETFANLGVRVIQLTYNGRNRLGDGSMAEENLGLSPLGHQVIARLNQEGVLLDLSHSGESTCLEAIHSSPGPIAITHTGCRAVTNLPRNKTDKELSLMADKGGVAGIYFMPFLSIGRQSQAEDVIRHLEHALNVCGEDHVGIGTDGGVTQVEDMDRYRAVIREEVRQRQAAGISATGESGDIVPMIPDLQGPDQFRKLASLLQARGHSWTRIEKILGGNFLRLMGQVWG